MGMTGKNERSVTNKIRFNIVGRRYYVVTDSSGVPATDFYFTGGKVRGGVIVPRDRDSSGDIRL